MDSQSHTTYMHINRSDMEQVHVIILSYDNNEVSFIMENPLKLNLNENRHMFGKLLKLKYYMHVEM